MGLNADRGAARHPQALLIHGVPGSGRRFLALGYAARLLGIPAARLAGFAMLEIGADTDGDMGHADFMFLQPPPEKSSIPVEAVRELVSFLQLKSHQGGARVAVIWPADTMTTAAANSLLKTLEEPPPGGFIVLVATTPAALPATVASRCERLAVHAPGRTLALEWLRSQDDEADWGQLLDIAGGAPLRALTLQRTGFPGQVRQLAEDICQLEESRDTPVAVARRWSNYDTDLVTQWLYWLLAVAIRSAAAGSPGQAATQNRLLQRDGKALTMQALLQRLADVEEIRRMGPKAVRMDLQYAALLQRWYA